MLPSMAQDLHAVALAAEKNAEALATGLAQAQADPGVVKAVTQCAELLRKVVGALGQGQGQQPSQPPASQPQAPPAQPQPPAHTMDSATAALHAQAQARAAGR